MLRRCLLIDLSWCERCVRCGFGPCSLSLCQRLLSVTLSSGKHIHALHLCQGKGSSRNSSNEEQEKARYMLSSASPAMEGSTFQWTRGLENISSHLKYFKALPERRLDCYSCFTNPEAEEKREGSVLTELPSSYWQRQAETLSTTHILCHRGARYQCGGDLWFPIPALPLRAGTSPLLLQARAPRCSAMASSYLDIGLAAL